MNTAAQIDLQAIDLGNQTIQLSETILVWPASEAGQQVYRIEDRATRKFYRVGYRESVFLSLLDGKTTVAAACGFSAAQLGQDALSQEEAETVVIWLIQQGLATDPTGKRTMTSDHQREPSGKASQSLLQRWNPFWLKIPLLSDSSGFTTPLRWMGKLFQRLPLFLGLCLIVFGIVSYCIHYQQVSQSAGQWISPERWLILFIAWLLLKIVHEMAHAAACQFQGVQSGECGIVMILFAPLAYVDVSRVWRLRSRLGRMLVSAAGMYVELLIASIAMWIWLITDDAKLQFVTANVILTAGVSTLLFNANPLMRFDGYYLLCDALDFSNLYEEGSAHWRRLMRRFFYGQRDYGSGYSKSRLLILTTYGAAAFCWRLLVCFLLLVGASVMFSGAGIVLTALGIVAWFINPIRTLASYHREMHRYLPEAALRATVLASVACCVGYLMVATPLPSGLITSGVELQGVIQRDPSSIVRAKADGFVESILVHDGQSVQQGQPLLKLRNRDLENQFVTLQRSLLENQIQQRIALNDHDTANVEALQKDAQAIAQRIEELQPKVNALVLYAPINGTVVARHLAAQQGRFMREGDTLMRLANDHNAQLVALVDQFSLPVVRQRLGKSVEVICPDRSGHLATLQRIDPQARLELDQELASLAATNQGPLEVRSRDDQDSEAIELIDPHFVVHADWNESEDPVCQADGLRVQLRMPDKKRSLIERLSQAIRRLIQETKRQAELASPSLANVMREHSQIMQRSHRSGHRVLQRYSRIASCR